MKHELWLGLSVLLGGCSLSLGLDDQQPCSSDDECVYSNGQGSCVDNICMPPGEGSDSTEPTTGGQTTATTPTSSTDPTTGPTSSDPTSNTDTTADTDDTDTDSTDTDVTGCTQNTDCSTDQRCGPDNICLELLSAECQQLQYPEDDFDRNSVVFLGSIMPTGGAFEDLVQPLENAVQLAIEDFNDNTSLQGDRQVAWVACDSTTGTDAATAAASHLTTNVGVPAIVGPIFSESVLAVAQDVTIDNEVFLLTPTATATSITELNDNDLVWRTISPDTYQANGIIDRLIERRGEAVETRLERLLVLAKDDAYGTGLLGAIQTPLEDGLGGVEIHFATYENPAIFDSQEDLLASYGATIAGAFATLPGDYTARADHFTDILFIGTSETQALLYAYFSALSLIKDPVPLPIFHFSHGSIAELERMIDEIGPTPGTEPLEPLKPLIAANMEGFSPIVFDEVNFDAFNIRYRIRFNNEDALTTAALSYDAAMATLFAMSTVSGDEDVNGPAIATAFPRLMDVDGTPISFSGATLDFIEDARNALAVEGGTVDLQGVSGALTWDSAGDLRTGLFGWHVIDVDPGDAVDPRALPNRTYVLDEAPAATGTWVDM